MSEIVIYYNHKEGGRKAAHLVPVTDPNSYRFPSPPAV